MPPVQVQTLYGLKEDEARFIRALILIQTRLAINSYHKIEEKLTSSNDTSLMAGLDTIIQAIWKYGNLYFKMGGDIRNIHEAFPECAEWNFADKD